MSHNKQNVTPSETSECSMNTDSSDKTKAENEALTQELETLQKELQGLQETFGNQTVLEKNCEALKKLNEEMKEDHTLMKQEIQRLKEEHKQVTTLVECYEAEKEAFTNIQQENDNLQKEIQELQNEIAEANFLLTDMCSNDSIESMMTRRSILRQERQRLLEEYGCHPYREPLERAMSLKKENEDLEAQINDIRNNIQMRRDLEELKAEEKDQQKTDDRNEEAAYPGPGRGGRSLSREAQASLSPAISSSWLRAEALADRSPAIETGYWDMECQIQLINEDLDDLAAAKRSDKTPALQAEIMELRKNLQGESILKLMYESWKTKKNNIIQLNKTMEKERDKLIKKMKKENALKEKFEAVRAEIDDLRRQQEALKRDLLAAAKRSDKTLEAEKNYTTLERELEELRSKIQKEQSWVEKNNNLRAEIEALNLTAPALQAEIKELHNNLQGESVLKILYEAMKADKNNISQHNKLIEKERDALIKKIKKETL